MNNNDNQINNQNQNYSQNNNNNQNNNNQYQNGNNGSNGNSNGNSFSSETSTSNKPTSRISASIESRRLSIQRRASAEIIRPTSSASTASIPGSFGGMEEAEEEDTADWGGDLMDVNDDDEDWSKELFLSFLVLRDFFSLFRFFSFF